MAVSSLSLADLACDGLDPEAAMKRFAAWIGEAAAGHTPIMVAFNATVD